MKHQRFSWLISITILMFICSVMAGAQEQSRWVRTTENDELHARVNERFVLSGKYLKSPRSALEGFSPSLVIVCSNGKVKENYFSVGAVVDTEHELRMETRIDGKSGSISGDSVSTDGMAAFFPRMDLANLLKHHEVNVGINEFLGPQIVMRFEIPDSTEILSACSKDRILIRSMK